MSSEHRKQIVKHELWELSWLFLYLAFFFCALVAYDTLLLRQYQVEYWNFGFAVLNAFVITKRTFSTPTRLYTTNRTCGARCATQCQARVYSRLASTLTLYCVRIEEQKVFSARMASIRRLPMIGLRS
jgi:hypothetical protein